MDEPGESSSTSHTRPTYSKLWIPECSPDKKPRVGLCFRNLDLAEKFYMEYACLCGFDVRHSTSIKARDGSKSMKYMVCSRQGFKNKHTLCHNPMKNTHAVNDIDRIPDNNNVSKVANNTGPNKRRRVSRRIGCKARVVFKYAGLRGYIIKSFEERHNHSMASTASRQFLKINRNLDLGHQKFVINCVKANIGPMKSYRLFKESVGGYSNIGATAVDFKNFNRDLKAYIQGVDAQMMIDKLFRKVEVCSAFSFEYDVDESDQLTRVFWCDPVCRKNYALFGDVLSFDATYGTNRSIFKLFTFMHV